MSTERQPYQKMPASQSLVLTNTTEMMTVAQSLAKSGYFQDAKDASQAFAKILAGAELGIPPFAAMSGIHIVKGKPMIGGVLLGGMVKRSGKYDYRVIEQTATVCSIDFFQNGENIGNSTFTIEQAKKAGTQNLDKFPENMLFARAMSNGVKWYTPDVSSGPIYTDGEIINEPLYTAPVVEEGTAVVVDEKPRERPKQSKEQLALAMGEIQTWQNEVDALPHEADAWTAHAAKLRNLPNVTNASKIDLFNRFKEQAFHFGIDYNADTKSFYHAEPVEAETVDAEEA